LRQVVESTSQDYVLCVSSSGRIFQIAAHRIPAGNRSAKGEPARRLLEFAAGEELVTVLPVESYDEDRYLVTFSKMGKVKKSPLSDYKTADVDGLQDMKLADGDVVVAALLSRGQGEYFVTTSTAQTLRFKDDALRAQGRVGQGVAAIALGSNAQVVSASCLEAIRDSKSDRSGSFLSLLVVTECGLGKKVPLSQFPTKGRATAGVVTTELTEKDRVLLTMIINEQDHLLLIWKGEEGEQVTAIKVTELKAFTRARKGVALVKGRMLGVVKTTYKI
jgi:DNA gyrase subunit A